MRWGFPCVALRKVQEKNKYEKRFENFPIVPPADACGL